jgi:carboxypeptidase Q
VTTLEAVRVLIKLGLRPKRTIRFIAWSGEEYGGSMSGAAQYVRQHVKEVEKYIAIFESDLGSTTPYGFGYSGGPKGFKQVWELAQNLNFMNAGLIIYGDGDSVDSGYFAPYGVPIMRNEIKDTTDNTFYFSYHHSAADSMTMMNPDDMDLNVVAIASMMYMIADADVTLPRD